MLPFIVEDTSEEVPANAEEEKEQKADESKEETV